MKMNFQKYQGTGNDFIIVDDRLGLFPIEDLSVIQRLCHRKFGIGSDGLILIREDEEADFLMDFYNPDGSKSYCGNGSRCAVHFANSVGLIKNKCRFRAIDGIHFGEVISKDNVKTSILPVSNLKKFGKDLFINTGSPHYIVFCKDVEVVDLIGEARKIRYSKHYSPEGTNVNFVEITGENSIRMRTYERGVEDETLSCGTGVTAAALSVMQNDTPVMVATRGGNLQVLATKNEDGFKDIWLSGPAKLVYHGEIEIND